jgi:NAD(P)-dependent dehydrogenase (short-subunit alcohol dehydrogenase family)
MHIIVTGANGALGSIVADQLEKAGARVARIVRGGDQAAPGRFPCDDLANMALSGQAIGAAAEWLGGVDGLVNIAGGFKWEKIEAGDPATWQHLFASNVQTALACCMSVLPHLKAGGSIVNVGAAAAANAGTGMGAYATAKSGVARLTESLAAEVKSRRIRVNAILPQTIDTPQNRQDMPKADHSQWTSPAAIADVIHFLLSDGSRAITGALIPVTNAA